MTVRDQTIWTVQGGTVPAAAKDVIVFVGPRKSFSDLSLRTLESELETVATLKCDNADQFSQLLELHGDSTRLVVLDCRLCGGDLSHYEGVVEDLSTRFEPHDRPGLVLAFWDLAEDLGDAANVFNPVNCGPWADKVQGFLPMNLAIDVWLSVIGLLISGGTYFPAEQLAGLFASQPPDTASPRPDPNTPPASGDVVESEASLTPREFEVIKLVASGLQNKQIACALDLSEHTVKLHMHHIIAKLEVKNRTEAAMRFIAMQNQSGDP